MSFSRAVRDLRAAGKPSQALFDEIIHNASSANDDELADFARLLAQSGRTSPRRTRSADVASTGGPSSLTTLLCPLNLRVRGFRVPKVGVPGRPAGGVDVMGTIPGFEVDLPASRFNEVVETTGLCHVRAGSDLAPLDGELFNYRKKVGAVEVAELVIASLLSKKVAVGLSEVILEVRVWVGGNLGVTLEEARSNAARFCRVAAILGLNARCVLTDGSSPYQPYIGRGEALLALYEIFEGEPNSWLQEHVELCWRMVGSDRKEPAPSPSLLRQEFGVHLGAQGSSWPAFLERVRQLRAQPTTVIHATTDGFAMADLALIRSVLVEAQALYSGEVFPDPVGVTLLVKNGTPVSRGQAVAVVRQLDDGYAGPLRQAFYVTDSRITDPWSAEFLPGTA